MFEGQAEPSERLNLLYDDVTRTYQVIGKLTAAMTKCLCVKRAARGAIAIIRTLSIEHVVTAWRVCHAYWQGFESRARTATDIFKPDVFRQ